MDNVYMLGNQSCLKSRLIAVVGTRRVSAYGARMTAWFTQELVRADWAIVSGLALGVDGIAHREALKKGGQTIAVLAHGVDLCYPPEHRELRQQILDKGGLLVSGYPEGTTPTRERFLERNRLLATLSEAILVTCSPHKSGVKNTVKHAAELGRDVYVVTGPLDDASYQGTVEIIDNGGVPVSSPADLIQKLG